LASSFSSKYLSNASLTLSDFGTTFDSRLFMSFSKYNPLNKQPKTIPNVIIPMICGVPIKNKIKPKIVDETIDKRRNTITPPAFIIYSSKFYKFIFLIIAYSHFLPIATKFTKTAFIFKGILG
jgi:hypothetical protein